ncbi:MAG: hypothetical protein HFF23_03195 [Oscillospiraceae bacterium]|jgi:hypothetical protein|nr:hypothetical protein [Oscillospiraceae bacterium]
MKMKRLMCALLACSSILGGIISAAQAVEAPNETVVRLEDLTWERIDLSTVEHCAAGPMPLATGQIDQSISGKTIIYVTNLIDFNADDTVSFNCSYSPSSASMDFGVIASSGQFYYINVKGGSISQAIRINQAGNYAVAIRNNSSQTVRVVGFVDY